MDICLYSWISYFMKYRVVSNKSPRSFLFVILTLLGHLVKAAKCGVLWSLESETEK